MTATDTPIVAYKGFDKDLKCRGYQFEVGKTYTHDGPVRACESGFHACLRPLDVLCYYEPGTSRFAVVEVSGEISTHYEDSKIAAARLTVKAEVGLPEIIAKTVEWVMAQCKPIDPDSPALATGTRGAASATGWQGAASATGERGAASATGWQGAASATGWQGAASATGTRGAASATGTRGAAMAPGLYGKVMGADGCALFLVERSPKDWAIKAAWAGIVGRDGIKPGVWYELRGGVPVEVSP